MKVRSFISVSSERAARAPRRRRAMSDGGHAPSSCECAWPVRGPWPRRRRSGSSVASARSKMAGQLAIAHHRDAVGQRHHLVEVGGDEEDAEPVARPACAWCGRRPPWRRRRCRGSARPSAAPSGLVISALPITTFCWLPPDSEVTSSVRVGDLDREIADRICATACFSALPRMWKQRREARQAGQRQVAGDREDRHQALALAVLRDQREAAPDAAASCRVPRPPCRR